MMASALKLLVWALLLDIISAGIVLKINMSDSQQEAPITGGYQRYGEVGFYKFYALPTTWGYAWKYCKEEGGHLVVIDSDEEYKVVGAMMNKRSQPAYIGVHDIFVEGWFFTVKGERFLPSSYNIWSYGHPQGGTERNCVVMNKNAELQVEDCSYGFYFICEIEFN